MRPIKKSLVGWTSPLMLMIWSNKNKLIPPHICKRKPKDEFYDKTLPIPYIKVRITIEEIRHE